MVDNIFTASHFDAKIFPDQSKESGREVDFAVLVDRHIHSDEFLISQPIRAFIAEAQGRIHVLEHVVHLAVMDLTGRVWIVFGPYPDEFVQMMSTENGRVPREVVEIVHDDGNEQIQHQERTEEYEGNEISVGDVGTATAWFLFSRFFVARSSLDARQHDVGPCLPRSAPNGTTVVILHGYSSASKSQTIIDTSGYQ